MVAQNGEKIHPLSKHAIETLCQLSRAAIPTSLVNPGVVNRLLRGGAAVLVAIPNPFKTIAQTAPALQITNLGRRIVNGEK